MRIDVGNPLSMTNVVVVLTVDGRSRVLVFASFLFIPLVGPIHDDYHGHYGGCSSRPSEAD